MGKKIQKGRLEYRPENQKRIQWEYSPIHPLNSDPDVHFALITISLFITP